MNRRVIVRRSQKTAARIASQSRQRGFDIARLLYRRHAHLHPESWRGLIDQTHHLLTKWAGRGVKYDRDASDARRNLHEKFQQFWPDCRFVCGEASGVATWPCKALHQSESDGITSKNEYDWNRSCYPQQGRRPPAAVCQQHIR